jgi:pimeloyl-ACP methyl ester carboxylesterase
LSAEARQPLPPALPGARREIVDATAGMFSWYQTAPAVGGGRPLLLIHSVNAAASACEVRPLYEQYRQLRPVYAIDLPGYGFSSRAERPYVPRLMTDAVLALVAEIERQHPGQPIDALALSLGCEFLARAASERPAVFRTLALVSPTGFRGTSLRHGAAGTNRGSAGFLRFLSGGRVGQWIFRQLVRRGVIRYFLERTWGGKNIDADLLDYDYLTTRVPGAERAPFYFLSGFLFAADSGTVYESLPMPVWVSHGVRGDFTDYRALVPLAARMGWRVDVLPTGALPHFEVEADFVRRYNTFLESPTSAAA